MTEDLVRTPNGTFVTAEVAEAAGLEVPKPKRTTTRKATTKARTTKAKTTTRKPAARKRAATTRKGKA